MADKFLYDPTPHGWANRLCTYVEDDSPATPSEMAALRLAWKHDPKLQTTLTYFARAYKRYGNRAWTRFPYPHKYRKQVIIKAVVGIIKQGLV